jgi:1,4-alpha-glucan branching enzyme
MNLEEHNPAHFQWMMVDNSDQSVFAFERTVGDSDLLFVYNMTPNYFESYDVGCLHEGVYDEIFNSDKDVYGGWNQYNGAPLTSEAGAPENRPYHLSLKLGSYAAMILKRRVEAKAAAGEPEAKAEKAEDSLKKDPRLKGAAAGKKKVAKAPLKG